MAIYRIDGFKFNRANLNGLDATERSGVSRFLASRERDICTVETSTVLCSDGPFQGQTIELCEGSQTATLCIRGWIGHYQGGTWHGTTGQTVNVIPDQTNLSSKQSAVVAGKGFTLFQGLLSDMAEDFSDRVVETVVNRSARIEQLPMDDYGFTSDSMNEFASTYAVTVHYVAQQTRTTSRGKFVKAKKVEPTHSIDAHRGTTGNAYFMDDFGDLQYFRNKREIFDAPYKELIRRVTFTIGRTSYTVAATTEAVDRLRARIVKTKKWFADKFISEPRAVQTSLEVTRDIAQAAHIEATEAHPLTVDSPDSVIDAHIEALAAQDVAEVVAMAQACAVIEQVQALPSVEVQELATVCEGEASEGQTMGVGHATPDNNAPVAPHQMTAHDFGRQSAGNPHWNQSYAGKDDGDYLRDVYATHAQIVAEYEPSKEPAAHSQQAQPAIESVANHAPAYSLPEKSVYNDWSGYEGNDFSPDARQNIVIDAVQIALNEKLYYTSDVRARCIELLKVSAENQAVRLDYVEGGDVGMDIYYARRYVEAKNARVNSDKVHNEMDLQIGDCLGTLVFSDYKRTTGVVITEVLANGYKFTGKRGLNTVSGTGSAENLKFAIERAFTKKQRKTDYPAFVAAQAKRAAPAQPAAPAPTGGGEGCPSKIETNQAPTPPVVETVQTTLSKQEMIEAGVHPVTAEIVAREGLGGYGPMAQAEILAKLDSANLPDMLESIRNDGLSHRCPSGLKQKATSKSGAWTAELYKNGSGGFVLQFIGMASGLSWSFYETASDRMKALQALARAADAPDDTPPGKPSNAQIIQAPAAQAEAQTDQAPEAAAVDAPGATAAGTQAGAGVLEADGVGVEGCAHPKTESAPDFERLKPVRVDLADMLARGVQPEALMGVGVYCKGDMANTSGSGAITAVGQSDFYGLVVDVTLEDGRFFKQIRTREFKDGWFSLDAKMHGAPYLAQLAGAVAAIKARESSAAALKQSAHVQALIALPLEYPQLKRAENTYTGGKLAATNIRILLKASFKGVKFSVTSDYNSVRVNWTDGPTDAQVEAITGKFDIGASDSQSDYFYTVRTAFSDLFGGVQYLTTSRTISDALVARGLAAMYPSEDGRPTVQDYRTGNNGVFSWGSPERRKLNKHIDAIST